MDALAAQLPPRWLHLVSRFADQAATREAAA